MFYEKYFVSQTRHGQVRYVYEEVLEIIETKHSFYVMIGAHVGIIVEKVDCSSELIAFLLDLKSKTSKKKPA